MKRRDENDGRGGVEWEPTFDQLAAVCGARVELQGDDVTLGLVEELDWDSDRGRHGWGLSSESRGAERGRAGWSVVGLEFGGGSLPRRKAWEGALAT